IKSRFAFATRRGLLVLSLGRYRGLLSLALPRSTAIGPSFAVARASRLVSRRFLAAVRPSRGTLGGVLAIELRLADRLRCGAEIDADRALCALDAVNRRARDQVAIECDGTPGVVVAGNRVADPFRIGVRVHDRDYRHMQLAGLGDGDRLLVGVDHEHQIGHCAHVLDAAERALELVLLAGELQQLLLGEAMGLA